MQAAAAATADIPKKEIDMVEKPHVIPNVTSQVLLWWKHSVTTQ
jgi:hypothetical protein